MWSEAYPGAGAHNNTSGRPPECKPTPRPTRGELYARGNWRPTFLTGVPSWFVYLILGKIGHGFTRILQLRALNLGNVSIGELGCLMGAIFGICTSLFWLADIDKKVDGLCWN